jgi:O-acetyl-ADP-ribose deacetylase (regulator of RNase III)
MSRGGHSRYVGRTRQLCRHHFFAGRAHERSPRPGGSGTSQGYQTHGWVPERPVISGITIEISRGDITLEPVDAIVNAANASLRRGGGVCGAIFAAAGPELDDACAAIGSCETGDAVVTPGFRLPARWIVHTVGPVWHGGDRGEGEQLASCYRRSIAVAHTAGARSIAFPAISTGIFGYPARAAAEIAVATVQAHGDELEVVRLIAFDEATLELYRELLEAPA